MTQTNMPDKNTRKPNRIPVRFDDEAQAGRGDEGTPGVKGDGGVAPDRRRLIEVAWAVTAASRPAGRS